MSLTRPVNAKDGGRRARSKVVEGALQRQTSQVDVSGLDQDVSAAKPPIKPRRLQREDSLDPNQTGPRRRGAGAAGDAKAKAERVALQPHLHRVGGVKMVGDAHVALFFLRRMTRTGGQATAVGAAFAVGVGVSVGHVAKVVALEILRQRGHLGHFGI